MSSAFSLGMYQEMDQEAK